ncbi:Uncharacterised protein [uncultured archaeon]|nr:Uncharacterised protein [uncultured archaeon]
MVTKSKNKEKKVFCSLTEIKKEYLPKSFEKQKSVEPKDARELGISWAKEALNKIKNELNELEG